MVNKYYNTTSKIPSYVTEIMERANKSSEPKPFNTNATSIQNVAIGEVYYVVNLDYTAVKLDAIVVCNDEVYYYVHTPKNEYHFLRFARFFTKEEYINYVKTGKDNGANYANILDYFDMPTEFQYQRTGLYDTKTLNIILWYWSKGCPRQDVRKYQALWFDKYGVHFILDIKDENVGKLYTNREDCINENLAFNDNFDDDNVEEQIFTIKVEVSISARTEEDALNKVYQKYKL